MALVPRLLLIGSASLVLAFGQHVSEGQEHAKAATQEGEGHESATMPNEIWWKWANFAVLALGMGFLIGKNAPAFFRARSEGIEREIREAAAVRAEAEARAADIERRVGNLQSEIEDFRRKSSEEFQRERERMQAETRSLMETIGKRAEAEIASAAKHATEQLKGYSAELALQLATQKIQAQLTPEAQDALTADFARGLRQKAALN